MDERRDENRLAGARKPGDAEPQHSAGQSLGEALRRALDLVKKIDERGHKSRSLFAGH